MQPKSSLLVIFFFLYSISGFTQEDQINPPLVDHYSPECIENLPVNNCNLISNFGFGYTGSELQAFSLGNVYSWQDINSLTPDINGALGVGQGWYIPSAPSYLGPVNFASMLVDNLNQTTEGISTNIPRLEPGKKYALSFFLATSFVEKYRAEGGQYTFKVVLSNCQNFSKDHPGNPEIEGESQVIYCRNFSNVHNSEWQQYFLTFEAEQEYNTITIYPEVEGESFSGGAYVHFAYPELIPVDPTATFFEAANAEDSRALLTACGVANAQYLWESSNGMNYGELNVMIPGYESSDYEFEFSMEVPGAIGNSPEECSDADAPVIHEVANKQSSTLSVDCGQPVTTSACNLIPNPEFSNTAISGTSAFYNGQVPFWTDCTGTSDINIPSALPLPPAILGVSYASMVSLNISVGGYLEGIAAKIKPTIATQEYVFSFFISSSTVQMPLPNITFKAELTNCQSFTGWTPVIVGPKQSFFCEVRQSNSQWQQYVVRFVADGIYDMIVLYPSVTPGSNFGNSRTIIAYPELIKVEPVAIITNGCGYTLSTCTVKNAVLTWTDQNGTVVGTGQQINVGTNAATYTCTVSVPTAEQNPNNNCSSNNPLWQTTASIPGVGLLDFTQAILGNQRIYDDGVNSTGTYTVDLLATNSCSTSICHASGKFTFPFNFSSNMASGNSWSVYANGNLVTAPTSPPSNTYYYYDHYTSGIPISFTSQTFAGSVTHINFYSPVTLEFRLNNGSNQKSIFVTVSPQAEISAIYSGCYVGAGGNIYIDYNTTHTTSSTQYLWNTTLVNPQTNSFSPNIWYSPTAVGAGVTATVQTVNSQYGCERRVQVQLSPNVGDCIGSYGKAAPQANSLFLAEGLKMYPNPAKNQVQVVSGKLMKELVIYSVDGKMVKKINTTAFETVIDVADFKAGSYLFSVNYDDGTKDSKVIVKN